MEKRVLKAIAVSPIFSHRKDQDLELRSTEWKALMRTVFRWAQLEKETEELYKKETEYFGGSNDGKGYASPIRLQIIEGSNEKEKSGKETLVYRSRNRSVKIKGYPAGTKFNIVFRKYLPQGKSLAWYENMLKLSIVLSGVGKRSRRGRGTITLEGMPKTKDELLVWLSEQLNSLNKKQFYQLQKDRIENTSQFQAFKRPVIEKIIIGNEIEKIDTYLSNVDQAAHHIKKCHKGVFLTGTAEGEKRFASSLIVSIVQTGDGKKYPIYTFLKPVFQGAVIRSKIDDRQNFLKRLERSEEGRD